MYSPFRPPVMYPDTEVMFGQRVVDQPNPDALSFSTNNSQARQNVKTNAGREMLVDFQSKFHVSDAGGPAFVPNDRVFFDPEDHNPTQQMVKFNGKNDYGSVQVDLSKALRSSGS